jgi:hypothetical protein
VPGEDLAADGVNLPEMSCRIQFVRAYAFVPLADGVPVDRGTAVRRDRMDFKRRLVEEAKKEKRSVTNYIEAALSEYWSLKSSRKTSKLKDKEGQGPYRDDLIVAR